MTYEIILAYLSIIGSIVVISGYFEVKHNPIRIKLVKLLKEKKKSDVVESCKIFIEGFDDIYYNHTSGKYNEYIWAWIIISFAAILFLGPMNFMFELSNYYLFPSFFSQFSIPLIAAILFGLFFGTFLFIIYIMFREYFKMISHLSLFGIIISNYISALIIAIIFFFLALIVRIVNPWFVSNSNFPNFPMFNLNIYSYILLYIIACIYLFIVIFYFALFLSLVSYIIFNNRKLFNISPFRSILSSLIFIGFFSMVFMNSAYSFYSDFNQFGWVLLFYLFLNIFADCFSLLETRYVLELASLGTRNLLILLVVLDILANGFIFLLIPISTGNLNNFLDAMFLRGDKPWLVIFFWSSFGTSFIFYLYILSYLVLVYSKLEILPVIKKPFWSLGVVGIIIVTFIFLSYYIFNVIITVLILILGAGWFLRRSKLFNQTVK